jgi:two-component system chemotaxis response regulator CheY
MKALVVEDDSVSRKLLQSILLNHGECNVAVNGKEAMESFVSALAEKHPYDLICLDIVMPELDGLETLKKIREVESDVGIGGLDGVKVIITSQLADKEHILKAFREGSEAYLVKPLDRTKLAELLTQFHLV